MAQHAGGTLFAALRALTVRGAWLRPLVLVVEDLHWIDTSSEEFLTFLLDAVPGVPLLLLVTYRIGYTPAVWEPQLCHHADAAQFLRGRDAGDGGSYPRDQRSFPQSSSTALLAKAEGVPLFIEEVTKALLDLGVLQRENNELPSREKSQRGARP